ncbi:MAG: hypothetical protein O2845_00875 [Proteobacteria bacterium]|nr:hypothetical protein [Pseudomonadota bacterium]
MEKFGSWSVLTTDFLVVLYLALCGVLFCSLLQMANAQWRFYVRKLAVSLAVLFPVAFVLLLILLFNGESTFQWLKHAQEGEHHLSGWHNYTFLVARQIVSFLIVAGLFGLFIKYQHQSEIDSSPAAQRRLRNVALLIPFAYVPYATLVAWDFEMTMMPGWHSASYGAYHFVSNFHAFLGFFAVFLFFLSRSGKLVTPLPEHVMNYLAQMMFAFTILWTYLFFTQYLIFWYGRLPDNLTRYNHMMYQGYGALWWTFFTVKFVVPFSTFLFTANRHNPVVITVVGSGIVLGTWLERYTWISGSVDPKFYHMPMTAVFDVVVTLAVIVVAWFAVRWSLTRYGLLRSQ